MGDIRLGEAAPPLFVLGRDSQIPAISAVSCDAKAAIGERAMVDTLVDMLTGRRARGSVVLPGELVVRSSA